MRGFYESSFLRFVNNTYIPLTLSQIFLRDTHVLPKLLSYDEHYRRDGGKSIAVWLQSISGVRALNLLVAFYDIHGRKREVLLFFFLPDTTDNS
jgi:hypothetical protein